MFSDEAIEAAKPAVLALLLADGFTGARITGAERCAEDVECARFWWDWDRGTRSRVFHMDDFT